MKDHIKIMDANPVGFEAIVTGCFYDPYHLDAREISRDMVVVAPPEQDIIQFGLFAEEYKLGNRIIGR